MAATPKAQRRGWVSERRLERWNRHVHRFNKLHSGPIGTLVPVSKRRRRRRR